MRLSRASIGLLLLLALAACSGPDPAATAPSSSPAAPPRPGRLVSSTHPYTADGPATPTDYGKPGTPHAEVMYKLQQQVLNQAGAPAHTSVTCNKKFITGNVKARCTVKFDDLAVPMDVTVSIADQYLTWSAVASVGVLSQRNVGWLWINEAGNNNARPGTAMCDAAMPEQAVFPFGPTPFFCWYTTEIGTVVEKQVAIDRQGVTFEKA
ncbi:hypothetical protein C5N14_21665 [Micromonospora sp. MW-13]|uniref:hypothetical protein n=1 Tax=unclassified Micromonospora TaxID=2617518 RepID=UPI000E437547|nr:MULTISPECIES: hypothetical protein [unclassified Micromonospora]MCX4471571.1 hypothetical protein [Micromonospora sp. NBC_01655]RGC66818.1 hypothetical protein C5N14_21665 [Micromonospora sp. MW-13]